jgi:hypothetical protein
LPALERDAADVITGTYANPHSLPSTAVVDLIKNVLKNPKFQKLTLTKSRD